MADRGDPAIGHRPPVVVPGAGGGRIEGSNVYYRPLEWAQVNPVGHPGQGVRFTDAGPGYEEDLPGADLLTTTDWSYGDHCNIETMWTWISQMDDERVRTVASGWRRAAQLIEATRERLQADAESLAGRWQGQAAAAFRAHVRSALGSLDEWAPLAHRNSTGLDQVADAVASAQARLRVLYEEYEAELAKAEEERRKDREDWAPRPDAGLIDGWRRNLSNLGGLATDLNDPFVGQEAKSVEEIQRDFHERAVAITWEVASAYRDAQMGLQQGTRYAGPLDVTTPQLSPPTGGGLPGVPASATGAAPPPPVGGQLAAAPPAPPALAAMPPAPPPPAVDATPPAPPAVAAAPAMPAPPAVPRPTPPRPPAAPAGPRPPAPVTGGELAHGPVAPPARPQVPPPPRAPAVAPPLPPPPPLTPPAARPPAPPRPRMPPAPARVTATPPGAPVAPPAAPAASRPGRPPAPRLAGTGRSTHPPLPPPAPPPPGRSAGSLRAAPSRTTLRGARGAPPAAAEAVPPLGRGAAARGTTARRPAASTPALPGTRDTARPRRTPAATTALRGPLTAQRGPAMAPPPQLPGARSPGAKPTGPAQPARSSARETQADEDIRPVPGALDDDLWALDRPAAELIDRPPERRSATQPTTLGPAAG